MDASEMTDTARGLPPPVVPAPSDEEVDATARERQRRRRTLIIVLTVWALVMAGEIGYVIGRDRTSSNPAAARIDGAAGEFTVMEAIIQSLQTRLAASEAKANALQSQQGSTPAVVPIPLESFDPLGGAPLIAYSGTLALGSCTGFSDPSACAAQNALMVTLARVADGSLTLSSVLFDATPVTRAGDAFQAQGSVVNPTYALACATVTMATFFDMSLTPNRLTVTNGVPSVASFSATLTITAPPDNTCTEPLQSIYQGTMTAG